MLQHLLAVGVDESSGGSGGRGLSEPCSDAFSQALALCSLGSSLASSPSAACCAGLSAAGGACLWSVLATLQGNGALASGM